MLIALEETLAIQPYRFVSLYCWLAEVSESAVKSAVSCFCLLTGSGQHTVSGH